ncbi:MAG: copper resistance protein B [Gammaproteobacteria bacterium]|nr:copper resistance protein B [Gammaproteobacteria bacterium]
MKISKINTRHSLLVRSALIVATLGYGSISTFAFADEMKMTPEPAKSKTMSSMKGTSMQGGSAPGDARDPNAYSGGYEYRGMAGWEESDEIVFSKVIVDQLEYRSNKGKNTLGWDIQGWRGTDYNKFWFKFEGEDETSSSIGELELQALYSRAIAPFWDFQIGARYDGAYGAGSANDRFFAVVGFQGLAPYWFELEPALFISDDGDVSARIVSTYDLLFTQRLILQPRFEINVAATEVNEFGIGKGVNDIQLGFRLRYEIQRKVAPYVGLSWTRLAGDTGDMARTAGEDVDNLALVTGIRLWF